MKVKAEIDMDDGDFAALARLFGIPSVDKKFAQDYFTAYMEWVMAVHRYDYDNPSNARKDFLKPVKVRPGVPETPPVP